MHSPAQPPTLAEKNMRSFMSSRLGRENTLHQISDMLCWTPISFPGLLFAAIIFLIAPCQNIISCRLSNCPFEKHTVRTLIPDLQEALHTVLQSTANLNLHFKLGKIHKPDNMLTIEAGLHRNSKKPSCFMMVTGYSNESK